MSVVRSSAGLRRALGLVGVLASGACAVGLNTSPDGARGDATRGDTAASIDVPTDAQPDVRTDVRTDAPAPDVRDASVVLDARDASVTRDVVSPPSDVPAPPADVVTPPQPDVVVEPPVDVFVPPPVDVFVPPPVDVVTPPPVDVVMPPGGGAPGTPCANDRQCGSGGADCCLILGSLPFGVCACRDPIFRACQPLTCP